MMTDNVQNLALIFDFDGVVADSEPLANLVMCDMLASLGAPTTLEEAYARYVGKRMHEVVEAVNARHGVTLPDDFATRLEDRCLERFGAELQPIPGLPEFLSQHRTTPKAVGSSSPVRWLEAAIRTLGLTDALGRHIYSADHVARGKPAPDLFLHAAAAIGAAPADCVVIEDSPMGVQAGVAAGMRVVGLLAGGHIQPGHADRLNAAGAWRIAESYTDVEAALAEL